MIAAALSAATAFGCGSGSGASSSTESGQASKTPATAAAQGKQRPPSTGSAAAQKKSSGAGSQSGGVASTPHHDFGGGAAPFKTKGGDNSIQEFGGEGGGSEMAQAAAALHGYLDARAAGEWRRACENMAGGVTKSLQQLAGGAQSAQGGKSGKPKRVGCPQLIAAMSAGLPAYARRDMTKADVGALRVEGQRAFLLYHGAHHTDYFMPMAKEGGQWKVAALAASALP